MRNDARLQEAIAKAKAGQELSARDLFIDIVEENPDHKLAWLWLIGLLDDTDDLIFACREALRIDPADARVRRRLNNLLQQKEIGERKKLNFLLKDVKALLVEGKKNLALMRLRKIVQENRVAEEAWRLLLEQTNDLDEKVEALTRLQALNPEDEKIKIDLRRFRYLRDHPLELAASYEEQGEIEKARQLYEVLAAKAKDRKAWRGFFQEVQRLEQLQSEKIIHVSPKVTIARLSAGPPLLFLSFILMQIGFDMRRVTLLMSGEFLLALIGSFLLAVASVRSGHFIWEKLGSAGGRGSKALRLFVGALGVFLMFVPFVLLSLEAFLRWLELFVLVTPE